MEVARLLCHLSNVSTLHDQCRLWVSALVSSFGQIGHLNAHESRRSQSQRHLSRLPVYLRWIVVEMRAICHYDYLLSNVLLLVSSY